MEDKGGRCEWAGGLEAVQETEVPLRTVSRAWVGQASTGWATARSARAAAHQPPASRMIRCSTRAATSRRYSAVERTSSIGASSPASARRRSPPSRVSVAGRPWSFRRGGADRGGGHGARATRTSRHVPSPCHATAITTLLIAWARRVPTLRKRISRPAASGSRMRRMSSSWASAVCRYPSRTRRRHVTLSPFRAERR